MSHSSPPHLSSGLSLKKCLCKSNSLTLFQLENESTSTSMREPSHHFDDHRSSVDIILPNLPFKRSLFLFVPPRTFHQLVHPHSLSSRIPETDEVVDSWAHSPLIVRHGSDMFQCAAQFRQDWTLSGIHHRSRGQAVCACRTVSAYGECGRSGSIQR